jgi:hypothetical protein
MGRRFLIRPLENRVNGEIIFLCRFVWHKTYLLKTPSMSEVVAKDIRRYDRSES